MDHGRSGVSSYMKRAGDSRGLTMKNFKRSKEEKMEIKVKGRDIYEIYEKLGVVPISDRVAVSHTNDNRSEDAVLEWNDIKKLINEHRENELKIGAEYMAGDRTYQVADIDTDKHVVTFCQKYILEFKSMSGEKNGWSECDMRRYLNTDIFRSLPEEVRDVISDRTYFVSVGDNKEELVEVTDKLFLPRMVEVFGEPDDDISSLEKEKGGARQFELFKKTKERIRTAENDEGEARWYWLATSYSSTYFCYVNTSGTSYCGNASYAHGVVPCFIIAADDPDAA